MKALKYLEGRIRGWLPKEANMPNLHQATTNKFFPTHKAMVEFVLLLGGAAFSGKLLDVLGNFLGISSVFGIFWSLINGMVVTFVFLFIYERLRRKEEQREAQLREL